MPLGPDFVPDIAVRPEILMPVQPKWIDGLQYVRFVRSGDFGDSQRLISIECITRLMVAPTRSSNNQSYTSAGRSHAAVPRGCDLMT